MADALRSSPYEADPSLLDRAVAENDWLAAPAGSGWTTLAGGSVDGLAFLVTSVSVKLGTITVCTRMPAILSERRRADVTAVCAALNRLLNGHVASVDPDGAPTVTTKSWLFGPDRAAIAGITRAVTTNRTTSSAVRAPFVRLVAGWDFEAALSGLPQNADLLRQATPRAATVIDLASLPEPGAAHRADAAAAIGPSPDRVREVDALARYQALAYRAFDADDPICVGPVVLHQDGVAECYGCSDPLHRLHPGGTSGDCVPGRAFGDGHRCIRCADAA